MSQTLDYCYFESVLYGTESTSIQCCVWVWAHVLQQIEATNSKITDDIALRSVREDKQDGSLVIVTPF